MSPPRITNTSPPRRGLAPLERYRPPTLLVPTPRTEPSRSPVEMDFGGRPPMRQSHTIDSHIPIPSPRRRSSSLEDMRPRRTPSPSEQRLKRSRTNTASSGLPPSLAALALSGPVDDGSRHEPQSQSQSHERSFHPHGNSNGPPMSAPTLPPPRGWGEGPYHHGHPDQSNNYARRDHHHPQGGLPGPDSLFHPDTTSDSSYRR